MKSYHFVAIGIGVVMVVFSLITLLSFFYCIYIMCKANQEAYEVGNTTINNGKSSGYSRQTTRTISVEENRTTKLSPNPSFV